MARKKASAVDAYDGEAIDAGLALNREGGADPLTNPRPALLHQLEELLAWIAHDVDTVDGVGSPAALDLLEAFARARDRAEGRPERK